MKKLSPVLFIALLSFSVARAQKDSITVNYAVPSTYTIGGISVSGDAFIEKSIIISLGGLSKNQKITIKGDDISKAINTFMEAGSFFCDIKILIDTVYTGIRFI